MKLDDILGLLFLIFFVVIPAVQGLMKRGTPPRDLDPDDFPQPTVQKPKTPQPSSRPPATTAPPAPSRPVAQAPKPTPPAPKPAAKPLVASKAEAKKSKTLEEIERDRLARSGSRPTQNPAAASQRNQPPAVTESEPAQRWTYTADPHAILNGIVWQQVLSEPRSKYWRNRRKPKL